ncbi:hypothetical protein EV192_11776 [Actinocrispum wychmicini]|uniref:Uncharacterized protein n=1 Tax=Actinocrispum wychmicini TaxID=1213861 RepID=A0A4R2ISC1_9PSEU|nr:hypothetical protein EV192_11776 [Actinocrispum wychmicini]
MTAWHEPWHECCTADCDYLGTDVLIEFLGDALTRLYGDEEPDYGPCGGLQFHYTYISEARVRALCGHPVVGLAEPGVLHPVPGAACGPCLEIFQHASDTRTLHGLRGAQALELASQGLPPKYTTGGIEAQPFVVDSQHE